jgi:hypothetical protein
MHSIWLVLVNFCLCFVLPSEAQRLHRFLNSKVADRITVLEQSHTTHREDTSSTRTIFFGVFTSISFFLFVISVIIGFLCRRLRGVVRERQSPALAAVQASGLTSMHPMTNVFFQKLQSLDTIEQLNRSHPPPHFSATMPGAIGLNNNSLSSNALKF